MSAAAEKRGVKRKAHTIDFKYQAIIEVEKGRQQTALAKELGISVSTLATWVGKKDTIKKGYLEFGPKRKSMKTGKWEELEKALLKWFSNAREQGAIISGAVMLEKANQYAKDLAITDFEAKPGWLTRFKDRNGISFKSVCGESNDVDTSTEAVQQWQKKLEVLLQKYDPDCVYNADETGIFFKMLPNKTLEFKNVDCHGGKRSKERLTVLVCANMSGSDKLPLFVIGKSAKPRCFKGVQTLPTKYTSNKKAWMTGEIFTEWLTSLDDQMMKRCRKIVMVVDNCPAHPKVRLQNVELVFLPPNTTSKLQPMDQGIINNLKVFYRKQVVMKQIRAIESQKELQISVLDALRILKSAWECVSAITIANCYRHAGFGVNSSPNSPVTATDDDDDEFDDIPLSQLARLGNGENWIEYVKFREDPPTAAVTSDDDIIADIIDARQPSRDQDSDEEDDSAPARPGRSADEALDALDILQEYWETQCGSEAQVTAVNVMVRDIMRAKMRSLCAKRQTSILQFTERHSKEVISECVTDECRASGD